MASELPPQEWTGKDKDGGDISAEFPGDWDKKRVYDALKKSDLDPKSFSPGSGAPKEKAGWGRALGLGVRTAITGATNLPAAGGNLVTSGINKAVDLYNRDTGSNFEPPLKGSTTGYVQRLLDAAGLPRPETEEERGYDKVGQSVVGAGSQLKLLNLLRTAKQAGGAQTPILDTLTQAPFAQWLGSATGGAAGAYAEDQGYGPMASFGASMIGSALPNIPAGVWNASRRSLVGNATPAQMQGTISNFNRAGIEPTMGQVGNGRVAQVTESFLRRAPGSAGVAEEQRAAAQAGMGAKTDEIAANLGGGNPTQAGEVISSGLTGKGGWLDRFQKQQNVLHNAPELSAITNVELPTTTSVISELTTPHPGAKATTGLLVDPKLANFRTALEEDLAAAGIPPGPMPTVSNTAYGRGYVDPITNKFVKLQPGQNPPIPPGVPATALDIDAIRALRTRIGQRLESRQMVDDFPKAELKRLYGALSRDLEMAAMEADMRTMGGADPMIVNLVTRWKAGNPITKAEINSVRAANDARVAAGQPPMFGPATTAMRKANEYTRSGHQLIETSLQRIIDQKVPENMFNLAMNSTENKYGATRLKGLFSALNPTEQDFAVSAVVSKMGKAKAGMQRSADGSDFSSDTFLTNWLKMSPEARQVLFGRDPELVKDMDAIAFTAAKIRKTSKVDQNSSGTSGAAMRNYTIIAGGIFAINQNWKMLGSLLATTVANYGVSKALMTSPGFVHWMAKTSTLPRAELPAALNQLTQLAAQSPELKPDIDKYISGVQDTNRLMSRLDEEKPNKDTLYMLRSTIKN